MKTIPFLIGFGCALLLICCNPGSGPVRPDGITKDADEDRSDAAGDPDGTDPLEGEFRMLTYNVAGLPAWLSGSDPDVNIPLMSPRLNAYDLVLVQEDFWYHDELTADITRPHRSEPMIANPTLTDMGDGPSPRGFHAIREIREHEERREGVLAGQPVTSASLQTFELLNG